MKELIKNYVGGFTTVFFLYSTFNFFRKESFDYFLNVENAFIITSVVAILNYFRTKLTK